MWPPTRIAFVQVKSRADQSILDDYVQRFGGGESDYQRMIFAVHKPIGTLNPPAGEPVQIWSGQRIAKLAFQHGLGTGSLIVFDDDRAPT